MAKLAKWMKILAILQIVLLVICLLIVLLTYGGAASSVKRSSYSGYYDRDELNLFDILRASIWETVILCAIGIVEGAIKLAISKELQEDSGTLYSLRGSFYANDKEKSQVVTGSAFPYVCPECHSAYDGDYCTNCGYQNKK